MITHTVRALYIFLACILIRYFVAHRKRSVFTCSHIQGIGAISYACTQHIRKSFKNSGSCIEPNALHDKIMKPLLCVIFF